MRQEDKISRLEAKIYLLDDTSEAGLEASQVQYFWLNIWGVGGQDNTWITKSPVFVPKSPLVKLALLLFVKLGGKLSFLWNSTLLLWTIENLPVNHQDFIAKITNTGSQRGG